jgi:polyisoprenoid-binding protein YceI
MTTAPPYPPEDEQAPRRRRRRWPWFVGGAVLVVVIGLVAGPFIYIHFIQADPAAKLTFENADKAAASTTPTTAASGAAASSAGTATTAADASASSAAASASGSGIDGAWAATSASQLGYRVKEVLFGQSTEAVGRTNDVQGQLTISGTTVNAASFTVQVDTIKSDQSQRDSQFNGRIMNTSQFPTATFKLTQPIDFGSVPADKVEIKANATGELTLHGVTKSVTFPVTARRNGANLEVSGSIPVVFADYNIPNPSNGPVTTEDNGVLEFLLVFAQG